MNNGQKCNFIGIIHILGNTNSVQLKNGLTKTRINIQIVDESGLSIILCIWGRDDLEIPQCKDPIVIAIKNVKYSDFGKHSLNSNDESEILFNP